MHSYQISIGLVAVTLGLFTCGFAQANCQVTMPEGSLRYEGSCVHGLAHGQGRAWIPTRLDSKSYYTGLFVQGKLHGKVDYTYANGKISITDYFLEGRNISKQEAAQPDWYKASQTNTLEGYRNFIENWPDVPQVVEARQQTKSLLEPRFREAESAFKCEDASRLANQLSTAGFPSLFNYESCVDNRKFLATFPKAINPQRMYLAGVKYENEKKRDLAKRVYLTIMDRFPEHAMAVKAADRLAGINDVEAVENSNIQARHASDRTN